MVKMRISSKIIAGIYWNHIWNSSSCFQVVIPPTGGYWVDQGDQDFENQNSLHHYSDTHSPNTNLNHVQTFEKDIANNPNRYKVEKNETALQYRKNFMGKVRIISMIHFNLQFSFSLISS